MLILAIIVDSSAEAGDVWKLASRRVEATAKFFSFYDRKLLLNRTRFITSVIKLPIFDEPLIASQNCKSLKSLSIISFNFFPLPLPL